MDDKQKRRIERYLTNASDFMWGLGPGNQRENYDWLKDKGFSFTRGTYRLVEEQLIRYPGIEEVIKKIVVPTVQERFPEATLSYLRRQWYLGERPRLAHLKKLDVKAMGKKYPDRAFDWRPFVAISTQFHYVERWGEFAGIWFEEIEPLLREGL